MEVHDGPDQIERPVIVGTHSILASSQQNTGDIDGMDAHQPMVSISSGLGVARKLHSYVN